MIGCVFVELCTETALSEHAPTHCFVPEPVRSTHAMFCCTNEESPFQTCTLDSELGDLSVSGAAVWRGPLHTHKHLNSNGKVTDRHATTVKVGRAIG